MKGETIISIFFLFIASYFLYLTLRLPTPPFGVVGPKVWPAILLLGVILSCIGVIYSVKRGKYVTVKKMDRNELIKFIGTILFILLYTALLNILGFFVSTLVLFMIYLRFMGLKLWKSIIAGVFFAFFATIVFPVLLTSFLPRGQGIFYDITSYILSLFGR